MPSGVATRLIFLSIISMDSLDEYSNHILSSPRFQSSAVNKFKLLKLGFELGSGHRLQKTSCLQTASFFKSTLGAGIYFDSGLEHCRRQVVLKFPKIDIPTLTAQIWIFES